MTTPKWKKNFANEDKISCKEKHLRQKVEYVLALHVYCVRNAITF